MKKGLKISNVSSGGIIWRKTDNELEQIGGGESTTHHYTEQNIAILTPIKRGVNSCVPGYVAPDPFTYMSMESYFSLSGSDLLYYLVYCLILSGVVISLTMDDRNIISGPNVVLCINEWTLYWSDMIKDINSLEIKKRKRNKQYKILTKHSPCLIRFTAVEAY